MASRQSSSARRWRNRSSASAGPSTPLRDHTNIGKTTSTPASANNTTFLPELNSTPPMPTFQKPSPSLPSPPLDGVLEDALPSRKYGSIMRPDSEALPQTADPGRLLGHSDRVEETPPLPTGWTTQHDRAICVLDARNYSLATIVVKLRRTFPGLNGILTPAMVDKRLRQLDQDVEIDYWRVGLQGTKNAVSGSASRMDSGSALTEAMANRVVEPTLKTTVSGSLVKSHSMSHMLPDTVSLGSESSRINVTGQFMNGYRTHAV